MGAAPWADAQDHAMQGQPPQPSGCIDHPRIRQEFVQKSAHGGRRGCLWRTKIDQQDRCGRDRAVLKRAVGSGRYGHRVPWQVDVRGSLAELPRDATEAVMNGDITSRAVELRTSEGHNTENPLRECTYFCRFTK